MLAFDVFVFDVFVFDVFLFDELLLFPLIDCGTCGTVTFSG